MHWERCAIRHLPNDTITVSVSDFEFTTVFGDPGFPVDAKGGNDTMTATVAGGHAFATLVGDDATLNGHSHGGNDGLAVNLDGFESGAVLVGDAQSMLDHARGGNDTLHAEATNSIFSGLELYGDAQSDMSGHTRGGNDSLTALIGSRALNLFGGDAGGAMTDNAHGGNDTINVTQANLFGSAELAGDAVGSMSGHARGGNDHLIYTMGSDAQVGNATLWGDAGSMTDNTHGGNDVLTVVVNGDPATASMTLIGDASTMSGSAHGGNDVLLGGSHTDFLYGDAMSYFPSTPGSITGGRDILNGGGGNDQLWGGPNNDMFVFRTGSGMDVINDFDQGNLAVGSTAREHDVINVRDYGFANWAALSSLISDDSSGNAVVHLSASDTITLNGVHTAALHPADFII